MDAEGPADRATGRGRVLLEDERLQALLLEGARLFDAGRFFDSHEAWEQAWHGAPQEERDFFQGLVHAAAACLHHERANAHGYSRQLERLRRRLGQYPPPHRGVDTTGLIAAVERLRKGGGHVEYPRLRLEE